MKFLIFTHLPSPSMIRVITVLANSPKTADIQRTWLHNKLKSGQGHGIYDGVNLLAIYTESR